MPALWVGLIATVAEFNEMSDRPLRRTYTEAILLLLLVAYGVIVHPAAWSLQHAGHHMSNMPETRTEVGNGSPSVADLRLEAKRLHDKRESELNHHIAGFLVALAGLFLLLEHRSLPFSSRFRVLWPACFLAGGLFLFVFSDTEIWPFGSQTLWYAVTHDAEDLQHKLFALILFAVGVVEYQRVRGRCNTPWVFSIAGIAGAVLLLFHSHSMDMHHVGAMQAMQHIEVQHRWYATVGAGVVTAKHISEVPTTSRKVFMLLWPVLLIVLGLLLMLYTE